MNAQNVLCPNDDLATRSNGAETMCCRVNPDDWDDDGIANERDANPAFCELYQIRVLCVWAKQQLFFGRNHSCVRFFLL